MLIGITGSSGHMGKMALTKIMEIADAKVRLLLLDDKKDHLFFKKTKRLYGDRCEALFGDIRSYDSCLKLTKGCDYLIHMAALIPPQADHNLELAVMVNYGGTKNIVDSLVANGNRAKLIHISTVAVYGHRDFKHPWGRAGDPLLVSPFDVYGTSKLRAEQYVLESELKSYVVLRQSGILYDNLLLSNISDGLMFHTPWNVPIEWASDVDSANLLRNIIAYDEKERSAKFWKGIYNIGSGMGSRSTGYQTFERGFSLIGGSCQDFFKPSWNAYRNFHCFWFSDSDLLEELFHFRKQGFDDFWHQFARKHRIYKTGHLIPKRLIRSLLIKPLLKNDNAIQYFKDHQIESRVYACFGEVKVGDDWRDFPLIHLDDSYEKALHNVTYLSHGYDEEKDDSEISLEDVRSAIEFRGGRLLSEAMRKGDLDTKLHFACAKGHEFLMKPRTMLKGGHSCPICETPDHEWRFDELAKTSKFFAQVWYDTHEENENKIYYYEDGIPKMRDIK